MRSLGIYSLGALLGAGLAQANAPPAKPCAIGAFSGVLPPEATVLSAVSVPAGGSYGEGPADIAYPINPTNLPELCALIVNVSSSASSSFRFGVFLPADWNERMLTIGNGGFAGGINWLEMGTGVKYGHAVVSTDTGHNSTAGDNEWALRAEEKRKDFGYRAIHGSVAIGKKIVAAYYGKGIAFSYYSGGSTGGRQGLKELQLHADSFDGALIGAPAWWTKRLQPWTTRAAIWNLPVGSPNHVPVELFKVLEAEVLRQCDAADGVADGIVSAPEACSFDFSALACKASGTENASSCFTEAQIETMRHIYAPYTIGDELVFPGAELSSESQMPFLFGGSAPSSYGDGYIRNFVLDDPDWTWQQYNDSLIALSDARDAGGCTADGFAAMKQFARAGGKLVLYHGLADALIPPGSARVLRDKIRAAMRAACQETDSWFRFFLVPGMQHVQGTAVGAPWYFGGSGQAAGLTAGRGGAPGDVVAGLGELGLRDAKHDLMLAMMEWVEKGRPIDEMVATSWNVERDVTSGVLRQRVLCSEPKKQVFIGGDEKKLENWKCE